MRVQVVDGDELNVFPILYTTLDELLIPIQALSCVSAGTAILSHHVLRRAATVMRPS